jgi:hypothetical protein
MAPTDSNNVKNSSLTSWPISSSIKHQSEGSFSGLRQKHTLRSFDELPGDICSNDTFAMNLWCWRRLVIVAYERSRLLEVIIDIKP